MEEKEDRVRKFLKELSELSLKYKITIGGCGCCGSPWINTNENLKNGGKYKVSSEDVNGSDLMWVSNNGK